MDRNIAAWMIGGGLLELGSTERDREQRQAVLEHRSTEHRPSWVDRVRAHLRPAARTAASAPPCLDAACCAA